MGEMKNAYELAMERLGGESQTLSEEQKQALAEVDSKTRASIAEAEIMLEQQLSGEPDPAKAALMKQTWQEQIAKIRQNADEEKERVRCAT